MMMERRAFLALAAASALGGCASMMVIPVMPTANRIRLDLHTPRSRPSANIRGVR
jgi:hypothetical protein